MGNNVPFQGTIRSKFLTFLKNEELKLTIWTECILQNISDVHLRANGATKRPFRGVESTMGLVAMLLRK